MAYTEIYRVVGYTPEAELSASESFSHEQLAEITELYRSEYAALVRRAMKFNVRDPEATVQTAFSKALKNWNSYIYTGKPRSHWMNKILTNTALSEVRRSTIVQEELARDAEHDPLENLSDFGAQRGFEEIEQLPVMQQVRDILEAGEKPEHWYSIFVSIAMEGYAYDETAERLGVTVGTVKSAYHRTKEFLKSDPEFCAVLGVDINTE